MPIDNSSKSANDLQVESQEQTKDYQDKYIVVMETIYADRQWFRMPKVLHKIKVTVVDDKANKEVVKKLKDAAFTLASLLNQSAAQQAALKNNGFFDFSSSRAEDETGFSADRQLDHLSLLEKAGLIQRERAKKRDGKRLVRINYPMLVDLINEALQERENCLREIPVSNNLGSLGNFSLREKPSSLREIPGTLYSIKEIKETHCSPPAAANSVPLSDTVTNDDNCTCKATVESSLKRSATGACICNSKDTDGIETPHQTNSTPRRPSKRKQPRKPVNPTASCITSYTRTFEGEANPTPAENLTQRLYKLLSEHNRIVKKPNLRKWAKEFQELLRVRTYKQIREGLKAHDAHLGDQYWPQFYCAHSICEGWARVEKAMERLQTKRVEDEEEVDYDIIW